MHLQYAQYCQIIALLVGFFIIKKSQPFVITLVIYYCGITVFNECLAKVVWQVYGKSTHLQYNIYNIIRFVLIYYILKLSLDQPKYQKTLNYLAIATLIIAVCSFISQFNFIVYNALVSEVFLLFFIISSGIYYIDLLTSDNTKPLLQQPIFFVITGMFIYSLILAVRYAVWDYLEKIPNYSHLVNVTNIISNTIIYVFIIIAFVCQRNMK